MSKIPIFNAVRIIPRDQEFLDRKLGAFGEIFYDRDSNSLRLYDGKAAGGIALSKADLSNVNSTAFREKSVDAKLATVVYTVTVAGPQAPDTGNKYNLNSVYRLSPNFVVGYTYVFVQDDATNVYFPNASGTTLNPHPLNFSADNLSGELGDGTSYLDNVEYLLNGKPVTQPVYNGLAFNTAVSRQVRITVTNATPATLYYWCYNHQAMGAAIAVADPGSGSGIAGSSVAVSISAPASPEPGNLWLDTATGILYVYFNDGDSEQWIQPVFPYPDIANLATVAVSGSYTDLTDTPTIPTLLTDLGIADGTVGQVLTTDGVGGFTFEDTTSNSVGNFTFVSSTIDTTDQSSIQVVPAISMSSDLTLETELVFSDGSRQSTATLEGPEGPPGPTGSGAGDVSSVGDGYVDNAVVRYSGTSGASIQTSSAVISDTGTLTAVAFSGVGTSLTALNASNLSSGTVPDARFPATLPSVSGVNVTALNASNLSSGTVPIAALGTSGTRDSTTFLRGDNTFATVTGGDGTASNSFATIAVAGQNSVAADSATDTLTLIAGANITITTDAGTDAITIAAAAAEAGTASNSFTTIAVSGQNSVEADSATDTLTLIAGTGIAITTDAGTDAVTVTSTVSSGATAFTGLSDRGDLTVDRFYLTATTMLNTTNNGASSYRFDQHGTVENPTVVVLNGTTIAFNLDVAGHPFLIQTSAGANYNIGLVHVTPGGTVTTGSDAQGQTSGTLYWKIPTAISGNYRYICSIHGGMVGVINIVVNESKAAMFASPQFGTVGVGTAASGTSGEIRATDNITAFFSSDVKFKENIREIDSALEKVVAIGGKYFDWTDEYIVSRGGEDGYFVRKSDFGVIAQDVLGSFPIAVRTRKDGALAVDYEKLCSLAFGAIKQLEERVRALEAK